MTLVHQMLQIAKTHWASHWDRTGDEQRLRLAGIEQEMRKIVSALVEGLWEVMAGYLDAVAEGQSRMCGCGRRCERQNHDLRLTVLGIAVLFSVPYFYCRVCKKGTSPVRRWLGLEAGGVSMELERKTTDLTTRMTFGDAVDSLHEQHGHEMDRTQAERITYAVGKEATPYLDERRRRALDTLATEGRTQGPHDLQFTADGGIVMMRTLQRPPKDTVTDPSGLTPARELAKGTWETNGREVRLISVHKVQDTLDRKIDLHIAPYNQTDFTGERMLTTAFEAGLSDNTAIHGVFDMGTWIHPQFNEQFHAYERTLTADISHVTEYLANAGRVLVGSEQAKGWAMSQKHRLLDGDIDAVLGSLSQHRCGAKGAAPCQHDEHGTCLVRVAERYLRNHRSKMNYPETKARGLAVGSGEAECGVKLMKKRMNVAGGWKEDNAKLMLALLTVRKSGWWDDFWAWRNQRDIDRWRKRQHDGVTSRFRGRPCWQLHEPQTNSQSVSSN